MKIYKQIGSKERFLEMFQNVNKIKLNEAFGQNYNPQSVLEVAFTELKSGNLKVKHSNTQTKDNENFIELLCVDNNGNNITFTFKTISSEQDQEGVYKIDNVIMMSFTFDDANSENSVEMDENALKQFNAQHNNELFDIIDEYIDIEEEEPVDSLYEEAIQKIDSYPFGGGRDNMQTGKAYADEKPTNPDVRVSAEELEKYINEMDEFDNQRVTKPKAYQIINTAYDNLITKNTNSNYVPTSQELKAEVERITGKSVIADLNEWDKEEDDIINQELARFKQATQQQPITVPQITTDDTKEVDDEPVPKINEKKKKIIWQAYDNIITRKGNPDYAPTINELMGEINILIGEKPVTPEKRRVFPKEAEPFLENTNKTNDYPDIIGKEFKPETHYPKKKKIRIKKVKISANESTDHDKYENVVFLQGDEAFDALERLDREGEDAALEYLKQWHYPGEHEGSQEENHGTADKTYRKDGYIMSWNPSIGYIGLQYDLSKIDELTMNEEEVYGDEDIANLPAAPKGWGAKKVAKHDIGQDLEKSGDKHPLPYDTKFDFNEEEKMSDEDNKSEITNPDDQIAHQTDNEPPADTEEKPDDGMSLEPQGDEVAQLAQDKEETGEMLQGGLGDEKSPLEFDPEQILKGMKVELEHTDNPMIAIEITMDHLTEIPNYYDRLEKMEADVEKYGAGSTDPMNPSGCFNDRQLAKDFPPESFEKQDDKEMTDMLLGYKPKNVGDEVEGNEEADLSNPDKDMGSPAEFAKKMSTDEPEKKENELGESKESELKQRDPATWHQIQIAKKTVRMPGAMAGVMGGMSKEEAKKILTQRGIKFTDENVETV